MKNRNNITLWPVLLLLLLLSACRPNNGAKGKEDEEAGKKPLISVTIEPVRYLTEVLAAGRFDVQTLVPQGSSPETYDPTPAQLADLARSCAYLRVGYIGFELSWMDRLTANAPDMPVFDLSEGIDLIRGSEAECTHHHHTPAGAPASNYHEAEKAAHHHDTEGVEPHIWNSPANATIMAGNILHALCTLDPDGEAVYRARHDSLCHILAHTDSVIRRILSSPQADRAFMIYHPALSYFARDYGLHQIAIEAEGKEPSAAHLKALIEQCRNEQVNVIFIQPEFDKRNAELIAQQTGTHIIPINPLAYNLWTEMIRTASALNHEPEEVQIHQTEEAGQ